MNMETLTELVEAHQAELFRYLRFVGADHATAEDLVQETFLRAFHAKAGPHAAQETGRRAWLRRIAHNLFIDHCRRHRRSPVSFSSEQADAAEEFWQRRFYDHDEGFGCIEALEQCLQALPAGQRGLIDAFYARRQSREEIAESRGISADGVKVALRRLRAALAECIQHRLSQA